MAIFGWKTTTFPVFLKIRKNGGKPPDLLVFWKIRQNGWFSTKYCGFFKNPRKWVVFHHFSGFSKKPQKWWFSTQKWVVFGLISGQNPAKWPIYDGFSKIPKNGCRVVDIIRNGQNYWDGGKSTHFKTFCWIMKLLLQTAFVWNVQKWCFSPGKPFRRG